MFSEYYDMSSGTFFTNPKYKEILRLDEMLTKADIPHTLDRLMDGFQICYPCPMGKNIVMDAIEHCGSYGSTYDKLEIMGLLTPEESEHDSVIGHLTAEEVFERIRKHYFKIEEPLPHTRTDPVLNDHITEIINDFQKLIEKAKSFGLDIKLTPNSETSLELYFHDDYPDTILVDKEEIGM